MKYLSLLLLLFNLSCNSQTDQSSQTPTTQPTMKLTYLALGDSYTIGEAVDSTACWPMQLTSQLRQAGIDIADPQIIATTGWTTGELIAAITERNLDGQFDMVSLLIGVNNQYRGYDFSIYQKEFPELLATAIKYAGGDTSRVFVVSIPDYGVTPFGQSKDPEKIAMELDAYNAFAKETTERQGIQYFNITDVSRQAASNPLLTADDQLHPSGEMYRRWTEIIYPTLSKKLMN